MSESNWSDVLGLYFTLTFGASKDEYSTLVLVAIDCRNFYFMICPYQVYMLNFSQDPYPSDRAYQQLHLQLQSFHSGAWKLEISILMSKVSPMYLFQMLWLYYRKDWRMMGQNKYQPKLYIPPNWIVSLLYLLYLPRCPIKGMHSHGFSDRQLWPTFCNDDSRWLIQEYVDYTFMIWPHAKGIPTAQTLYTPISHLWWK